MVAVAHTEMLQFKQAKELTFAVPLVSVKALCTTLFGTDSNFQLTDKSDYKFYHSKWNGGVHRFSKEVRSLSSGYF